MKLKHLVTMSVILSAPAASLASTPLRASDSFQPAVYSQFGPIGTNLRAGNSVRRGKHQIAGLSALSLVQLAALGVSLGFIIDNSNKISDLEDNSAAYNAAQQAAVTQLQQQISALLAAQAQSQAEIAKLIALATLR